MEGLKSATRRLDELGRIIIPRDIRDALVWGSGTRLEVVISDISAKTVTLREVAPCCTLCRSESENLAKIQRGYVCRKCAAKIKQGN